MTEPTRIERRAVPRIAPRQHLDPLDPSLPSTAADPKSPEETRLRTTRAWAAFRDSLLVPGLPDRRSSVLDDLTSYSGDPEDVCLDRCIHWEQWSSREWFAADRSTPDGIREFYRSTESWTYDLLWYAYLQAEGYHPAATVAIADDAGDGARRRSLDIGAGVGVTGQTFAALGYDAWMADVSTTLLDVVRHRLTRRGHAVQLIDLNDGSVREPGGWDVVTAIDVLTHVDDLAALYDDLHSSMRPGARFYANFDVRPKADMNSWHLHHDDLALRYQIQRAGFEPSHRVTHDIVCYRRVERRGVLHAVRGVRDFVLLRSPLRPLARTLRSRLRR
jgi:SAM-dependent methyltransferase